MVTVPSDSSRSRLRSSPLLQFPRLGHRLLKSLGLPCCIVRDPHAALGVGEDFAPTIPSDWRCHGCSKFSLNPSCDHHGGTVNGQAARDPNPILLLPPVTSATRPEKSNGPTCLPLLRVVRKLHVRVR